MPYVIAIVVIAILIVVWVISSQRKFVSTDEMCGNALSQIGVQQASRWDALSALAQLTKGFSEHEYKTLMDTVAARRPITASSTAAEVKEQENMITQAMSHIMAVAESYPDIKAQSVYQKTMASVDEYEGNVRRSRMVYNDTVTKFNRLVRQLPTSLIAGILGFKVRDYLEEDEQKADMPSMS